MAGAQPVAGAVPRFEVSESAMNTAISGKAGAQTRVSSAPPPGPHEDLVFSRRFLAGSPTSEMD